METAVERGGERERGRGARSEGEGTFLPLASPLTPTFPLALTFPPTLTFPFTQTQTQPVSNGPAEHGHSGHH